jgi:two-component SAPR family response regulator
MPKQPVIAKITRPRLSDVLQRPRMFRLLDRCRKAPVTWVSGPAGSGKTTLIANYLDVRKTPCLWYHLDEGDTDIASFFYYLGLAAKKAAPRNKRPLPLLTPEYLMGVPVFTRKFFENLFARLKTPSIVVLDNYHDVPGVSPFHDMIRHGFTAVPQGIRIIVISRSAPPASLADMRIKNNIEIVGWEELRFTVAESSQLLHKSDKNLSRKEARALHEKTQGWAVGLVLMSERTKLASEVQLHDETSKEKLFEYFAGVILAGLDSETREFLLTSSFLPMITVEGAAKLTGNGRAGRILSWLSRNNFFTEKLASAEPHYIYHPLFREFLQSRIKDADGKTDCIRLQKRAAEIFEEAGQPEEAAPLCIAVQDWQSLGRIILRHAPSLMAQGRSGLLDGWLASLPDDIVNDMPWFLYWRGICRFSVNPAESLAYLKKAYQQFRRQNEVSGVCLAWAGIVDSVLYSFDDMNRLDEWIESYDGIAQKSDTVLPAEIAAHAASSMLMALVFRQPWRADLDEWLNKALQSSDSNMKIQALFHYIFRLGNIGGMGNAQQSIDTLHRLADCPDTTPFHRLTIYMFDAMHYSITGHYQLCRTAANLGLRFADESGVHLLDHMLVGFGMLAAYNYGDVATAGELFSKLPPDPASLRPWDRSFYYHLHALKSFFQKDVQQAFRLNEQALNMVQKIGDPNSPFLCGILHAQLLHELGKSGEAKKFLDRMIEPWRRDGRSHDAFLYYLTKAHLFLDQDHKLALDCLSKGLSIGKEERLFTTYYPWQPAAIGRLFRTALEQGIEVEYVRALIRKRNLVPEDLPLHIENWPWPIRIYTLGSFEILKDDKPIQFTGKVQKKPLEMFKVLIALGGTDVAETQIMDTLWPDAAGDTAQVSFRTTLHRLRKLLGSDDAVQLRGGHLSVNPRYCWVDSWSFERLFKEALRSEDRKKQRQKSAAGNRQSELSKALDLYKGQFLPSDVREPWAMSLREHLRSRFLQLTLALGRHWEESKQYDKAAECYQQGLQTDGLTEEFYQNLMVCHVKRGQQAEAVKVYHLCRAMLVKSLGIAPSTKTEEIYASLLNN